MKKVYMTLFQSYKCDFRFLDIIINYSMIGIIRIVIEAIVVIEVSKEDEFSI